MAKIQKGGAVNFYDFDYRVRYADTDKMGVSYYANYFVWFEAARTEYFRALGFLYTECEKKGFFLPVAETAARYLAPSTYDDLLTIRTAISEMGRTRLRFEYQVFKKEQGGQPIMPVLIATGFSEHVFVDRSLRPVRVPAEIKKMITPFRLLS